MLLEFVLFLFPYYFGYIGQQLVCNKLLRSTQNNEPFSFGKLHFDLCTISLMDTIKAGLSLRELAFTTWIYLIM